MSLRGASLSPRTRRAVSGSSKSWLEEVRRISQDNPNLSPEEVAQLADARVAQD